MILINLLTYEDATWMVRTHFADFTEKYFSPLAKSHYEKYY